MQRLFLSARRWACWRLVHKEGGGASVLGPQFFCTHANRTLHTCNGRAAGGRDKHRGWLPRKPKDFALDGKANYFTQATNKHAMQRCRNLLKVCHKASKCRSQHNAEMPPRQRPPGGPPGGASTAVAGCGPAAA